jgi:hypothetical protein
MNDAKYIVLDVHQATISATVLDSTGKLVMEAILETSAVSLVPVSNIAMVCCRVCNSHGRTSQVLRYRRMKKTQLMCRTIAVKLKTLDRLQESAL